MPCSLPWSCDAVVADAVHPDILSKFSDKSSHLYFITSTFSLAVLVYIVFRHRITMNTPYQAMKSALAAMNDILFNEKGLQD